MQTIAWSPLGMSLEMMQKVVVKKTQVMNFSVSGGEKYSLGKSYRGMSSGRLAFFSPRSSCLFVMRVSCKLDASGRTLDNLALSRKKMETQM